MNPSQQAPAGRPTREASPPRHPGGTSPSQRRNFAVMVAHMVLHRVGWVFKLESAVIPTFVGSLTRSPYALAALPVLSRLGRRLPPLIGGRLAYGRPRLRGLLLLWTGSFAAVWAAVSVGLWLASPGRGGAFLGLFFFAYALSFFFVGTTQVTRGALVGRLIPVRRRGAYVGLSSLLGGAAAVPVGLYIRRLLAGGEKLQPRQFAPLFACAALFFSLAALAVLLVREKGTDEAALVPDRRRFWRRTIEVLRRDRNFRLLIAAVLLLQVHGYIFPFYKRLGEEQGVLAEGSIGVLVLVQNVSLAVSTLLMGRLADRSGHRRVLLVCFAVTLLVPVYAVAACRLPGAWGRWAYLFVFALIGVGPSLQRFLANYVLEISTPPDHAVYLSTFATLQLATVVYAPVVALTASRASITAAMLGAAGLMGAGLALAFRLVEPRTRHPLAVEVLPAAGSGEGET